MASKYWIANEPSSTVTAAQAQAIAALDTTELGFLNGGTAGTITASKSVVVDSNKAQDSIFVGTSSSPVAMSSALTQLGIVSGDFVSDIGASQDARMFFTRCKISKAVSSGGSIYGSFNQLRINSGSSVTAAYSISGAGVYAAAMAYVEASDTTRAVTFKNGKFIGLHAKIESVSGHSASAASFYGICVGSAVATTNFSASDCNYAALRIEKDAGTLDFKHAISIDDCASGALMLLKADTGGSVISVSGSSTAASRILECIKLEVDSATGATNVDRYIYLHERSSTQAAT